MTTAIILISILYGLPTLLLLGVYFAHLFAEGPDNKFWEEVAVVCIILFPLVSLYIWIRILSDDSIRKFKRKIKSKRKIKKELKERERKIKLGVIRFSEVDPFGEEIW